MRGHTITLKIGATFLITIFLFFAVTTTFFDGTTEPSTTNSTNSSRDGRSEFEENEILTTINPSDETTTRKTATS